MILRLATHGNACCTTVARNAVNTRYVPDNAQLRKNAIQLYKRVQKRGKRKRNDNQVSSSSWNVNQIRT